MKKIFSISIQICVIAFISTFVISSCNKKFDSPLGDSNDTVAVNFTIKQLKALHTTPGSFQTISDDNVISGIVTANDSSGNFYNEIVIQDNTGAIYLDIQGNDLYTTYPVGRKIYVKLKGLTLGDYGGGIQLGGGIYRSTPTATPRVDGILSTLADQYIVKGSINNIVVPVHVTPSQLDADLQNPLQSTLVELDSFEFAQANLGATYASADKTDSSTKTYDIENCSGQTIELYNSSYAYFATLPVPQGNGKIIGIYTPFTSTSNVFHKEIIIRDTSDLQFYGTRCGSAPSGPTTAKTIADLRAMYSKDMQLDNYTVGGTVISNSTNASKGSFVLQSGNSGIDVYASGGTITYNVGDSVVLTLSSADSLLSFHNSLELKLHSNSIPAAIANGKTVTPVVKTVAQVLTSIGLALNDPNNFEYTLVQINSASVAGTGTYSGSKNLSDASSKTIALYTSSSADFAQTPLPAGNQNWVGYAYNYNSTTQEFSIRSTADVTAGSATPPPPNGSDFTATYDFSGVPASKSGTTDPTAPPTASGITFGSFSAINVSDNSSGAGRFSFSSWPTGATDKSNSFTGSIDETKYYEVTITPASGKTLDLSGIAFTLQRSASGVRQAAVRSSIDNYAGNLPITINPSNDSLLVVPTNILQVADGATVAENGSNVTLGSNFATITQPVTFRFYGFNAEATGGTFSIDNVVFTGSTK